MKPHQQLHVNHKVSWTAAARPDSIPRPSPRAAHERDEAAAGQACRKARAVDNDLGTEHCSEISPKRGMERASCALKSRYGPRRRRRTGLPALWDARVPAELNSKAGGSEAGTRRIPFCAARGEREDLLQKGKEEPAEARRQKSIHSGGQIQLESEGEFTVYQQHILWL